LLPQGLIAFAGQRFDRFEIANLNEATRTNDCTSRLYFNGRLRDCSAANPEHLSEKFVREHDRVALGSVTGLQQPPAEPCLEPMQRITRHADPRLCEQTFVTA
jgi:hypothetical protein